MYTNEYMINSAAPPADANVPTRAEAKRLRRSRRLAPQDDTNAPPQQFLELAPLPLKQENVKAKRKEKRRAQKLARKQQNPGVPNQATGGEAGTGVPNKMSRGERRKQAGIERASMKQAQDESKQ
jgi:hypothetical protein